MDDLKVLSDDSGMTSTELIHHLFVFVGNATSSSFRLTHAEAAKLRGRETATGALL